MELRAVVFGARCAGKSSLINAVFGKDLVPPKKRTAHCKMLQGSICGRELTLVDTPGWWKYFPLSDTAKFVKQELVHGVSLCHPGPHVILLVIKIEIPFTEKYRKAVEDHLGLLGGQIWTHTFVVFTRSHSLGDRTIEEHIEKEGEALQWVIERCGNRYHVFDSAALKNESRVKQLLEKIEDVVRRKNGAHFQIEAKILEETAEWKKTVMIKATSRVLKLQEQKTQLNKEGLRIALLGWVIAGKSSAGNTIFNRTAFATNQSTLKYQCEHGEVDGRPVTVIDTPSWFKYFPAQYTPEWIKSGIIRGVCPAVTSPHCILLVIPADTSFNEEQKKVIQENMSFLGEHVWRHTIVLFTWGDILGDLTIEEHIESEGEALQWVVEKCGNRYHVFNNEETENHAQVTELLQKIDDMVDRNSLLQLYTEAYTGALPQQKAVDTQADPSDAECDLQDVVRLVDEEWKRRDKELLKKILKVKAEFPRKGNKSMDFPPNLNETRSNTVTEETELESSDVGTVQDETTGTIKLKDQIKEMLDREWSRREEALMRRVLEMLSKDRCDSLWVCLFKYLSLILFFVELRAVVFGGKFAGKSSLINALFGKDLLPPKKRTAHCKKLQGSECGRELTLVDTPGWWKHFSLSDTAEFLKQELVYGVSLCHPGPHAILLLIEIDIPFTEKYRKAVEDHLGLLGDQIWTHTLVVFTRSHSLGDRTIEEHIEKEGEALQWVIERCGNRYHVFDSAALNIESQVKQLLEKIEDVVRRNNGAHFQIEAKILEEAAEWKRTVMIKARSRVLKLQEQTTQLNTDGLRIALLGWVIAGKSSAGNTIFNRTVFATNQSTLKYQSGHGEVDGRPVTVIDTPSWFKYFPSQYSPARIKSEIFESTCQTDTSPHCILLVIPADTSFKEEQKKVIQENMSFLGEDVWRHTIVLFTWGDILGDLTIEQHIESEGEALQWVVEKCGNRYHLFNNEETENRVQVTELLQKIDHMLARNSLFKPDTETFSGMYTRKTEADAQAGPSGDERDLQDVVQLVDEEWRRRDKELLKRVLEVEKTSLPCGGNRSIGTPPNRKSLYNKYTLSCILSCYKINNMILFVVREMSSNTEKDHHGDEEVCQTEPEASNVGTVQDEDKSTLKLKDQFKEMLDREWSRREEALMGRFLEMMNERRCELQSEPELRAVLYGGKFAGKSSLINTVLGKDLLPPKKRTAQCKKLQGTVCGRELTLVDTPGWWKHLPLSDTAEFLKQELVQGVSLCHPGPHAILLVIEIDIPFTEKHRKAAEDHLELLGGQIWTHTLVVFTRSHSLVDRTIEDHIEKEGEALQWVIERCGNRYHVFDIKNESQVKQLLEKIEDVVRTNNDTYFQIEAKILEAAAEWKKTVKTKATSRVLKLQEQITELNKEGLRIVLLGWVVAGKSSAGNTIFNKKVFAKKQSNLKYQSGHGEVDGRPVTVIDTPSWFKYFPSQYNPAWIKSEIFESIFQTDTSPHCILLVIPADTSFKEEQKTVIQENMSFLGEDVWRHTIVLFTWGDILGDLTIEEHIASEGEALQWVVEKCGNRYHVFNNEERENRVQVTELLKKIDEMLARNSFKLNAETFGRIYARKTEEEAQDLQEVVQMVYEEWRRRDKDLQKKVLELKEDIKAMLPARGDKSMDFPPECVGTVQDEDKNTLNLKDQIKQMLDLEWSRREESLMGRVLEMLNELRCELRAVLYGGKFAGKTSLINAVLGKDLPPPKKRTAHCKKLQGTVCGRELTLVDTPGWWKHFPLSDTAEFLKQELVQGVSLCPPGPHAILLVIEIDIPFTEKHRKAVEDHLELLGSQIWTHTLVVFTRSRSLGDRTIEQHIKKEGEALQWVIERCGKRYHVFDSAALNTESQLKQLLEKIEDVRKNNDTHFQIEAKILEAAAEWKETVKTKASARKLKLQEQTTQVNKEGKLHNYGILNDPKYLSLFPKYMRCIFSSGLRIALLGWVIGGKSSAGNTIFNRTVFATNQSTLKYQSVHGEVDGRPVTVIDTPSWFKYFPSQYTPEWIKSEIFKGVGQTDTSPHCILLVIPADTSFKEQQKTVIQENMSFLGEDVWRHTIVLFTWGDILGDLTIEEHIESEGEALQWVVEKCGNRYHLFNNEERENRVQVLELLQKIDEMLARNSFKLNAETFGRIHARKTEEEAQDLQEVVQLVDEEWRRRDEQLQKKVLELKEDIKALLPRRGDRSMGNPPDLSETSLNTEKEHHGDEKVSQTEPEASSVGTVQDEDKSTLKLKDQIKQMLDREWSRREESLMGRFLEMWSEIRWEVQSEPELRAVVFGGKFAGKSSLINTVFGKKLLPTKKRTAHCKKLQGSVCGRELTLVDTPGWWKHFPLSDTPEFLKQELVQGVSLCHPGPHVILLLIEIDIPFTEKARKAVEDHLGFLGGQIWTHTLVVFTRSHSLVDRTIEDHIEKEGEALQWVIERCGNRYHVFDSAALKNESQVKQLLEKIEDVVQRNNGAHFQIEAKKLEAAAEWKKTVMTKASARELKLQEQKAQLKKKGLRIALLGWVIGGKSSAGNTIFNRTVFATNQSTLKYQSVHGEVDGRPVTVIDTPSWFKYFPSQYTPEWIKSEIFKGVGQTDTSPHCILLVIPADTSFKEEQRKVIQENMSFLGEDVWRHTIVLFTWGDILGDLTIAQHIESEGKALQWVVEKCGNRYHVFNNEEKESHVQVTELFQKIDEMVDRNSSFKPNTETFGGIHARKTEADAETGPSGDERDLEDVVRLVDEEWRRRDKKLLKRVSEVKRNIEAMLPRRGDRSMGNPPDLSNMSLNTEHHGDEDVSQTEPEASNVGTVQDENKSTLELKDQTREMLEQVLSRREEALIGKFLEMWSKVRCVSEKSSNTEHHGDEEVSQTEPEASYVGTVQDEDKSTLNLKDQCKEMLDREWSRREEALIRRFLEMWSDLRHVCEMGLNTEDHGDEEVFQTEPDASNVGTVQDEDKSTLKLKDQFKEMLDREWSRREAALLGNVLEMLSEIRCAQFRDLKTGGEDLSESGADTAYCNGGAKLKLALNCNALVLLKSALRAVVYGGKFAGKSSLINTVFGKDLVPPKKRTAQCKKLQGTVCGRELTLVDTPGWWKHFPLSDTAEFLKQELVYGVSLCHPGPHAILLVIEIDIPFTEKHRKAAEDHLELLGGQIWTHTLVVFTRSHSLGDRTIEEHIEKEGEALQWVIERCGNRYHVFDSAALNNESQVKQLLEKIEDVVRRNNDTYFQIEEKILEEAAEWKKTVMAKATCIKLKLQEQMTQLTIEGLRIVLLGWVIAGKSSAGNTIFNRTVFAKAQNTLKYQSVHGEVDGRPVTVIDTPSWYKYFPSQYTPEWIKSEIFKGVGQTDTSPHCILLVIPADTSFKEQQRKVIQENMSSLGEDVWRHTIVLFTWGVYTLLGMIIDHRAKHHCGTQKYSLSQVKMTKKDLHRKSHTGYSSSLKDMDQFQAVLTQTHPFHQNN
ncbi:hypothetical protein NFI96_025789 [Prochilodus magdalenae]|nr:hypothetical protein NFI96_025789 [Prochilodus magdalenae]